MANLASNTKVRCFVICFLCVALIVGITLYKPPLKNATVSELDCIYGIRAGGVIMEDIQEYIMTYPDCKVEDLRILKRVDDMIIDQLKERFR